MNLEDIYRPVRTELETVERRLLEILESENELLTRAVFDILKAGGKRLRPALVLMASKACGDCGERSVRLAVALELIHTTSLIHDDVIDGAELRRGTTSVNARWGNKISVLAGDHLYAKVVSMLVEDGDLDVLRTVAAAVAEMTHSEIGQTLRRHEMHVTEEEYLATIGGKTGSLMSCCCRVGAMLGNVRDGEIEILADYGLNLGMAFQITDDLLDLTGDKEKVGKSLGNDIREGRLTLPLIRTINIAGERDTALMIDALRSGQIDESSLFRMRNMVAEYGGAEYSLERAKEYGKACQEALSSLRRSESQNSLALLAEHVVDRAC